jgi:hypothetical protein
MVQLLTKLMASVRFILWWELAAMSFNIVSRRKAAREVANVLGPEWKTTVLDWRLTPERLAKLDLSPNSLRKIGIVEGLL